MKKIITILFIFLLLAGCSKTNTDSTALVNNGDEVIFECGDDKYTKQDLNKDMKKSDFSSIIAKDYIMYVAELEGIDTEAHAEEIEESINELVESGQEELINYYYGSLDGYRDYNKYYAILEDLKEMEVKEDIDTYIEENKPYQAQYAYFDDQEVAEKFIKDVKAGGDFATLAQEAGYSLDATVQILNDKSDDVIIEIKDYVNNSDTLGLSDVIVTATTTTDSDGNSVETPRYYVLNLIDKDANNFKDDLIAQRASEIDETTVVNNEIAKYPLEIFDQATYEFMSSNYEGIE